MSSCSTPNYNGRQPGNTAYIKNFVGESCYRLWQATNHINPDGKIVGVIAPTHKKYDNLYIPGDLYIDGSLVYQSDINLKHNISKIDEETTEKIMNLRASSFTFKNDTSSHLHYGFIAQELEKEFPTLIKNKPDNMYSNVKAVNYLEIIPLLVNKIQLMQKDIDELKSKLNDK